MKHFYKKNRTFFLAVFTQKHYSKKKLPTLYLENEASPDICLHELFYLKNYKESPVKIKVITYVTACIIVYIHLFFFNGNLKKIYFLYFYLHTLVYTRTYELLLL